MESECICWILPKIHIIQSLSTPTCGPWFHLHSPWPQISVTRAASPDHPLNQCSLSLSLSSFFLCACAFSSFPLLYIPFLCLHLYLLLFVFLFFKAYSWVSTMGDISPSNGQVDARRKSCWYEEEIEQNLRWCFALNRFFF